MEHEEFPTLLRKLKHVHEAEVATLRLKVLTLTSKLNTQSKLNGTFHRQQNGSDSSLKGNDNVVSLDDPDLEMKFGDIHCESQALAHSALALDFSQCSLSVEKSSQDLAPSAEGSDCLSALMSIAPPSVASPKVARTVSLCSEFTCVRESARDSSRSPRTKGRAFKSTTHESFGTVNSMTIGSEMDPDSPGASSCGRKRSSFFSSFSAKTTLLNSSISLREQWAVHRQQDEYSAALIREYSKSVTEATMQQTNWESTIVPKKGIEMFIAQPGANWRLVWDLIGATLIAYDTVAIPFTLSFEPPDGMFLQTMDWTTMLFWSVDILLTFLVGYVHNGITIMSPALIARRYLVTWFFLDVIVVFADWFNNVGNASSGGSSVSEFGRMLRSLRAIRVIRLLRLLKLRRLLADLQDQISSEYTYLLLNLTKLLFFILVLNHGIACGWYFIGREGFKRGDPCWIEATGIMERNLGYKYTTSMHWTLTQFTPASMEVVPKNTVERTASVIVLMFALVAFSSFVGSISTSMTALRNMNADTNKQFWMLRRYLKQNNVARSVGRRILKYLEYVVDRKTGNVEIVNITILSMLTSQLKEELTFELTRPRIEQYPVFTYLMGQPGLDVLVRRLCATTLSVVMYAAGDTMFYAGDEAVSFYCFIAGKIEYAIDGQELDPPLDDGEWVAEAALFCPWKHMGRLQATAPTEIMVWTIALFVQLCCTSITSWTPLSEFANMWMECFKFVVPTDVIRDDEFRRELENLLLAGAPRESRRSSKLSKSTMATASGSLKTPF